MGVRPGGKQNVLLQEQLFDTHPEASLDFEIVRQAARQKYERPFLILDNAIVRDKLRRFRAAMPRVRPHYAVKANPDRRVVKALAHEGCGARDDWVRGRNGDARERGERVASDRTHGTLDHVVRSPARTITSVRAESRTRRRCRRASPSSPCRPRAGRSPGTAS